VFILNKPFTQAQGRNQLIFSWGKMIVTWCCTIFWEEMMVTCCCTLHLKKLLKFSGVLQLPCCLVQCECYSGKWSVTARNKSIIGIELLTSGFLENFGSLSQFPRRCKYPFCPLRTPMTSCPSSSVKRLLDSLIPNGLTTQLNISWKLIFIAF